jgi:hypothetical protein
VKVVAVHPGYAAANLQSHTGRPATSLVMSLGNRLVAQSDAMGAPTTLYGAVMDVPGGSYIGPDGFRHLRGYPTAGVPSKRALDAVMVAQLWNLSEHLTDVTWSLGPHR